MLRCHVTALKTDSSRNTEHNDIGNCAANEDGSDGDGDGKNGGDKHIRTGTHIVTYNEDVVCAKNVFISL